MKFTEKDIQYYTWKSEIYAALMSGNIVSLDFPNRQQAIKEIQELVSICDEKLIDKLLATENWRAKVTAGCLIGFWNDKSYIDNIGQNLVKDCGGITGYCYALARFADEKSVYYLTSYLDKYLVFDKFPNEKLQYWVFRALRWIDKVNSTTISQNYLGENGLWTKFVEFEFLKRKNAPIFKLSHYEQWENLEANDRNFEAVMNFYRDNFEVK